jgi:hypothetical protein
MGTTATVTSGVIDYTTASGPGSGSLAGSTASNQATTSATLAIVGQPVPTPPIVEKTLEPPSRQGRQEGSLFIRVCTVPRG